LVNKAILSANFNGQPVNVEDTASVNVTVPKLRVTKLGPGLDVQAGQTFPFTITAGVAGDETVNPLILVDELQSTDLKFVAPMPPSEMLWLRSIRCAFDVAHLDLHVLMQPDVPAGAACTVQPAVYACSISCGQLCTYTTALRFLLLLLLLLLFSSCFSDCVQNTDQKATCTWNEPVGPGDDKLVQFRVTANKTGTFQNRATVLTTMPGVVNQTATAPVTVVPGPVREPFMFVAWHARRAPAAVQSLCTTCAVLLAL
jgi:hypothetical protein